MAAPPRPHQIPNPQSSSPQPDQHHHPQLNHHHHQTPTPTPTHHQQHCGGASVRLMCSFGGRILPRPHDNILRYIGGETRVVAVHRSICFDALLAKLSKLPGAPNTATVKYQLPNEELDALISVANDEDVENMMEEYDRLVAAAPNRAAVPRLRVFLFPPVGSSRLKSVNAQNQNWFVEALNGSRLDRTESEVSSIVSDVPDYLSGLDGVNDNNPDDKPPAITIVSEALSPVHRTQHLQTEHAMEKLPTVEQKPSTEPVRGFPDASNWPQYAPPQPVPVYYIAGSIGTPIPYCHPVQVPLIRQNSGQPGLVYVGDSTGLGGHYGLVPPVLEGYDPRGALPVYTTVGSDCVVTTGPEGMIA